MYQQFWNLNELPFENVPDGRFFYQSSQHAEAFSRFAYILKEKRACGLLTGIYGSGKTMILYTLQQEFGPEGFRFSVVNNPRLDDLDILRFILHGFNGSDVPRNKGDVLMGLQKVIRSGAADGRHTVIVIDEAHTIENGRVFEELRLLLNFHTDTKFLLTLLLVGQPELKGRMEADKNFNQRVTMKYALEPFGPEDSLGYIRHRLAAAGLQGELFDPRALELIHQRSGGIPRAINNICHMSMLNAFAKQQREIGPEIVKEALSGV